MAELSRIESLVLAFICRYKIVSSLELIYHIQNERDETFSDREVESAMSRLEKRNLIFMPVGGCPKRYASRSWAFNKEEVYDE